MSHRRAIRAASLTICGPAVICLALCGGQLSLGQQPAKSAAPASATRAADDAARKAEILSSDCWRRAMFDFNSWLRSTRLTTSAGKQYTLLIPTEEDLYYRKGEKPKVHQKGWITE